MSAVSSSVNVQGLSQFFQSLSGTGQTQQTSPTTSAASTSAANPASTGQVQGGHHHHHGGGHGELFKNLQSAVTSALQSAQGNGSSDPNKIVEDAIAKVLQQQNGAGAANDASGTAQQTAGADPDGDGDTDAPGKADADGNSAKSAFFQTLQQYGINPQQFQADFQAAVKDAQGGTVNPSTAFQSFPPGFTVDTTA